MAPATAAAEDWRARLDCAFPAVQAVFAACAAEAAATLSPEGVAAWLDAAHALGRMGRGPEPVLGLLQAWPTAASAVGEAALSDLMDLLHAMQRSPNGRAMAPLLQTLAAVARRLQGAGPFRAYLHLVGDVMARTTVSLHGHHATFASPGLPVLLQQAPRLLGLLSVAGLARWADHGVRHHQHHPEHQRDYFALQLADSRAVLQRQRHGTLLADVQRQLELSLRALWQDDAPLHALATDHTPDDPQQPLPCMVAGPRPSTGFLCLPDLYDARQGVSGLARYQLALAHLAAHRRWSQPLLADNLSPLQRLTVECLEDARIDHLLLCRLPGLRPQLLALHPDPPPLAGDLAAINGLRHRLTRLSRALLDGTALPPDLAMADCVTAFRQLMAQDRGSTQAMADLALRYAARSRCASDQYAQVRFADTVVSYRDDNRHLWRFIDEGDEEDTARPARPPAAHETGGLPPRHYPEWDAATGDYRPDWVSLYEALHASGDPGLIDRLLARHRRLAHQLQGLLDLLKPQDRVRVRYQEEGSELDLDVALRAQVDWRAGAPPDPRILMSHRSNDRSISVLVLLDLSQSLNDPVPGTAQTRLELSQEAVALLAWAIDRLGDPLALAGFHSNTRHEVRYQHILGFGERWGEAGKARLAALQAAYSTRMGAALRHAAQDLGAQGTDKKLLLVLTDGRPCDIDQPDPQALVADSAQAVRELAQAGIHSHCISLDPQADAYVHHIFGHHATVVDRIEQLPERLARLFLSLTR